MRNAKKVLQAILLVAALMAPAAMVQARGDDGGAKQTRIVDARVNGDGTAVTSGGIEWTVTDPSALRGYKDEDVTLRVRDTGTNAIEIVSVKPAAGGHWTNLQDASFHK